MHRQGIAQIRVSSYPRSNARATNANLLQAIPATVETYQVPPGKTLPHNRQAVPRTHASQVHPEQKLIHSQERHKSKPKSKVHATLAETRMQDDESVGAKVSR